MGDEYGDCTLHQGRLVQSLSRTVRVGRQGRQAHQGCLHQGRCVKDAFYGVSKMLASRTLFMVHQGCVRQGRVC